MTEERLRKLFNFRLGQLFSVRRLPAPVYPKDTLSECKKSFCVDRRIRCRPTPAVGAVMICEVP